MKTSNGVEQQSVRPGFFHRLGWATDDISLRPFGSAGLVSNVV